MGWGEQHGPSGELVRRNQERMAADALARAVVEWLESGTTGAREVVAEACTRYREARAS